MGGTPVEVIPVLRAGHVVVHFDAGWVSRTTHPRTAAGAFVLEGRPFSYAGSFAGDVSKVVSWWKLKPDLIVPGGARRLLGEEHGAKGIQLFDLLAARAGIMHLRANKFAGPVLLVGDNEGVINFMRGEGAMRIDFSGYDAAPGLRDAILKRARKFDHLDWDWVSRNRNLAADAVAKRAANFVRGQPSLGPIFQVEFRKT